MSGMELCWLGQSGFRLRDPNEGPVVFVDPFLSAHDGRTWQAPITPEDMGRQVDVILCTHQHLDTSTSPRCKRRRPLPVQGSPWSFHVPSCRWHSTWAFLATVSSARSRANLSSSAGFV